MPRVCGDCRFCREEGRFPCYCVAGRFPIKPSETDLRDGICPLVEIPTPHGRLIDANDLIIANSTEEEMRELFRTVLEAED